MSFEYFHLHGRQAKPVHYFLEGASNVARLLHLDRDSPFLSRTSEPQSDLHLLRSGMCRNPMDIRCLLTTSTHQVGLGLLEEG